LFGFLLLMLVLLLVHAQASHSAGGSTDRSTRQGASAGNRHDRGSAGGPDCAPLSMRCCVRVMFAQPDTASAPTL